MDQELQNKQRSNGITRARRARGQLVNGGWMHSVGNGQPVDAAA